MPGEDLTRRVVELGQAIGYSNSKVLYVDGPATDASVLLLAAVLERIEETLALIAFALNPEGRVG